MGLWLASLYLLWLDIAQATQKHNPAFEHPRRRRRQRTSAEANEIPPPPIFFNPFRQRKLYFYKIRERQPSLSQLENQTWKSQLPLPKFVMADRRRINGPPGATAPPIYEDDSSQGLSGPKAGRTRQPNTIRRMCMCASQQTQLIANPCQISRPASPHQLLGPPTSRLRCLERPASRA